MLDIIERRRKLLIFNKYVLVMDICNEEDKMLKSYVAITSDNNSTDLIRKYCIDNRIDEDNLYLINFYKNNFNIYFNIIKYNDNKFGEVYNIIIDDYNNYCLQIGKGLDLINSNIIEIINYFNISNWILELFDNNYKIFKDIILKVFKLRRKSTENIYYYNWTSNDYNKKHYNLNSFFYYPSLEDSTNGCYYVLNTFYSLNYIISNFDHRKWNDNKIKKINDTFYEIIRDKSNIKRLEPLIVDYLNNNIEAYFNLENNKGNIEISLVINQYIKKLYFLRFLASFTNINLEDFILKILSLY